jgi:uncharacterized membrane protein YqjE
VTHDGGRPQGLLGSARLVLGALLDIGQTRLRLASTELEEERLRLAELLLFAAATLFFLGVGIVLATLLLVLLFWDGPRVLVLALAASLFLAVGAALAVAWRRKLRDRPALLAATVAELQKDRDALIGRATNAADAAGPT